MEKTAKITKVEFTKEYEGQHGKIFYHKLELDNGDKGSIGTKEKLPEKIAKGVEITYEVQESENGNKIKIVQKKDFMKRTPASNASFALAYAKDVVIGSWSEKSPKALVSDDLFKIADKMYNWLEDRK